MANFRRLKLPELGDDRSDEDPRSNLDLTPVTLPSASLAEPSSPWMTVVDAARYAGFPCTTGRAPNSFYAVARKIGYRLHGRWVIARTDLDAYIRGERPREQSP
jgi:hypothetical protein